MFIPSMLVLLFFFCLGNGIYTSVIRIPQKTVWIDFDETISVKDTTEHLAELTETSCPCSQQRWKSIWKMYLDEHAKAFDLEWSEEYFNDRCKPTNTMKGTATGDAIFEVEKGICQLNIAEFQLYVDLNCAGVFIGLSKETLISHGRKVPALHKGVGNALNSFMARGMDVHVLSLHWSHFYIWGALEQYGVVINQLEVLSNRLTMCNDLTTGPIDLSFINGIDKINRFVPYVKGLNGTKETVFIGDAIHDFPSMLYADLGIWMESQGKNANRFIRSVLGLGKVEILDLPTSESNTCPKQKDIHQPRIYRTRSWKDIQYVLEHCRMRL